MDLCIYSPIPEYRYSLAKWVKIQFVIIILLFIIPGTCHAGKLEIITKPAKAVKVIIEYRHLSFYEQWLIISGKTIKHKEKTVSARGSTFKKNDKDGYGRTNCERMKGGQTPIGRDGKPVELHHTGQQDDGIIVEIQNTEHNENSKILHPSRSDSLIDRNEFASWKRSYWIERGNLLCN